MLVIQSKIMKQLVKLFFNSCQFTTLCVIFLIGIFISLLIIVRCFNKQDNNLQKIRINNKEIQVEIADTPELRFQGLSGRKSLPENHGMLFVFENYKIPTFVMRGMKFSLDIIWIKDNKVIGCAENLPISIYNSDLETYSPPEKINYVVEVRAGFCEKNRIRIGNLVNLLID